VELFGVDESLEIFHVSLFPENPVPPEQISAIKKGKVQ